MISADREKDYRCGGGQISQAIERAAGTKVPMHPGKSHAIKRP
jgi:hypothetical protein